MLDRFKKWLIIKLVGDKKVAINCDLLDYNREKNFMNGNYISYSNKFYPIERLIVEEMYTGSANKKVYRKGNTFVLSIINEFPSAAEASRRTGIKSSNILNNTNGISMSAGGFIWEKENECC